MKGILLLFALFSFQVFAQDAVIAVGKAEQDKDKFVIDSPEQIDLSQDQKIMSMEFVEILRNNFVFYKHRFNVVDYQQKGQNSFSQPNLSLWKSTGVTYFVASKIQPSSSGIKVQLKVWNILTEKLIGDYAEVLSKSMLRSKTHGLSNQIYRAITGKDSIFGSKIVFVSDRTSSSEKEIIKELYVMDFDGRRVEKLTNFNSVVLSPSISPDNTKIMFSLIATKNIVSNGKRKTFKNIDLKLLDLRNRSFKTLSDRPGINSGAIFSSKPGYIYLTLSFGGNADIYEMNIETQKLRKMTTHYGEDVDPSLTKDGTLMSFLSSRSGRAHIYTMNPDSTEGGLKRISFVGQFNATPRFSPDGKEIVFTSWVDNGFDLYRISSQGQNLSRLTKDFGSNEEPQFSPDGEFIVFTSKRVLSRTRAVQDIYIMNRDGEILGQLTQDFGRCFSPQWSN